MDPARICTALVTNISHSSMEIDAKCAALKQFVRKDIQALRRYSKETRLDPEVQLALFVTVFEEMALVREEINEDEEIIGAVELEKCLQILIINLDDKQRSIWEIWATPRSGTNVEEMKRRERLFFLRFAVFMARQLPFSTEPRVKAPIRTKGRESIFAVVSKRDFILNLWYHGKIAQVPETSDTIEKAYDRIRERLMNPLTPMEDDPFHWIGDENEMVFELASYFFYEFPLNNDPRNRFEQFIATEDNSDLYLTKMALLLEDRAGPQETRARILQHIVSTTTFYSPGEFRRKLEQLVLRFPCNIPLLKAFLDVGNNIFKKYCFLAIHPGYDERSRLIRSSGHIYIALRKYKNEFKRSEEEENYEERALTGQLLQLIHFLKAIACENSDNLMPDDFIWTFLMRFVTNDGKGIVSPQCIDEIFALGQARCPWSKQFLIAALQGHSLPEEPFVRQINALIKQHGIKPYCSDAEAQLALQADQH